jgi:hypothetical protein
MDRDGQQKSVAHPQLKTFQQHSIDEFRHQWQLMDCAAGRTPWHGITSPRWSEQRREGCDHIKLQKPELIVWIEIAPVLLM